jgi:hypothetical protein
MFRRFAAFWLLLVFFGATSHAQVRVLFDATKGEMSGNADWVIDYDQDNLAVGSSGAYITSSGRQSNPQRFPTPAQSTITETTTEGFWSGGCSAWALDCARKGYIVETLPWNVPITFGITTNDQDLSNYNIYVVAEPNIRFTEAEKTAILSFVQAGGGLFMVGNHAGSDRNRDGWDPVRIWNDLLRSNSVQSNPFGILFDSVDFSELTTNVVATSDDPLINGARGRVTRADWSSGTSMTLSPAKNPTVKGVVYRKGTTAGNANVMAAYARFGRGKVVAIGDSSPTDDGSGNPNCTLYNGYTHDASGNHQLLIMNGTIWLASNDTAGGPSEIGEMSQITTSTVVFPNPSAGSVRLQLRNGQACEALTVTDIAGREVQTLSLHQLNEPTLQLNLPTGTYIARVRYQQTTDVINFVVTQ